MPEAKEELHHDEDTLKKVYEALMCVGIFGQQAVDAVSEMQNKGILFRENKPKRRGRPRKDASETPVIDTTDQWSPKEPDAAVSQ